MFIKKQALLALVGTAISCVTASSNWNNQQGGAYGNYGASIQQPHQQQPQYQTEPPQTERKPSLPPGWSEHFDPSTGQPYYYNSNDGRTTWDRPGSDAEIQQKNKQHEDEAKVSQNSMDDFEGNAQSRNESMSYGGDGRNEVVEQEQPSSESNSYFGDGDALHVNDGERREHSNEHMGYRSESVAQSHQGWRNQQAPEDSTMHPQDRQIQGNAQFNPSREEYRPNQEAGFRDDRDFRPQEHKPVDSLPGSMTKDDTLGAPPRRPENPPKDVPEKPLHQEQHQYASRPGWGIDGGGSPDERTPARFASAPDGRQADVAPESAPYRPWGVNEKDSSSASRESVETAHSLVQNVQQRDTRYASPESRPENAIPLVQQPPVKPLEPQRVDQYRPYQQQQAPQAQQQHSQMQRPQQLQDQQQPQQYRPYPQQPGSYPPNQNPPPQQMAPNQQGPAYGQVPPRPYPGQQGSSQQYPPNQGPPGQYGTYGQQYGHPNSYGQYPSYGQYQQGQLIEAGPTVAMREALGKTWQGLLGFGNRTKEVVGTAKDTVVKSAQEAGQTIGTTSTSWFERAKSTLGSVFEGDEGKDSQYSLSGTYGSPQQQGPPVYPPQRPAGYDQQGYRPGYPPQQPGQNPNSYQQQQPPSGHYPPGYSPPQARFDPSYPQQQAPFQGQGQPPVQSQYNQRGPPPGYDPRRYGQQHPQGHSQEQPNPRAPQDEAKADAWQHPGLGFDGY